MIRGCPGHCAMHHECPCIDKETRHAAGTVRDTPGTRHVLAQQQALIAAVNRLGAIVARDLFIEPGYAQRLLDEAARRR